LEINSHYFFTLLSIYDLRTIMLTQVTEDCIIQECKSVIDVCTANYMKGLLFSVVQPD